MKPRQPQTVKTRKEGANSGRRRFWEMRGRVFSCIALSRFWMGQYFFMEVLREHIIYEFSQAFIYFGIRHRGAPG